MSANNSDTESGNNNVSNIDEGEHIDQLQIEEDEAGENFFAEDGQDDDDDILDDDELEPDHQLYAPLQESLKKQLNTQYDVVDVEIRDKLALKNKLTAERENVGVELYAIQQTLAKLQTRRTEANERRARYEQERLQKEEELKEIRQVWQERSDELKARTKEYENLRDELDKLNEIVLRLEQHNQDMLSQVAVTRRETYKSEQAARETEISKQEQDFYIDKLTRQVQDLGSGLAAVEAQIIAQRAETKTARDALLQASLEMEKITFERNHLIQEWNSSLVSVRKRAETLTEIETASAKQEEEIRALKNEYTGVKKQIANQHEEAERNTGLYTKISNRIQYLDGKIKDTEDHRNKLQETLQQLNVLTHEKEQHIARLLVEKNQANIEFKQSLKGANEISNQIHELEDKIISHVTEQTNMKRDAVAAQNAVQKVRDQIDAKDRELSLLQNEVMKLKIDKLNITGQCAKFERGLADIVDELKQKEALIAQYEMQIRKNNVYIEKLQSEVDKLNKKYEELTSAQNGEEYGPLERKIRALESKIQQSDTIQVESQTQWLKKQTELVALTRQCEKIEENNKIMQANLAVMSRKRDRTKKHLEATEKEIDKFNIQVKLLQREMSKLGEQLSVGAGQGNILIEGNINFEADILEQLRQKEEEAARTESRIEELANIRESIAEDLMETEKTIMMWEKKLQLAREMREALDPNYGTSELFAMKKEITRMELRLKQIKKQQQTVVQNMEFALRRRETIATRGAVQRRLNQDRTRSDVVKGITELKRDIKRLHDENHQLEGAIKDHIEAHQERNAEIEQLNLISKELQIKLNDIQSVLSTEERNKVSSQSKLEKLQSKTRMYKDPNPRTLIKKPEAYEQTLATYNNHVAQLGNIIDMLADDYPHLSGDLTTIKQKMSA